MGTYGQINILRQNCDGLKISELLNNLNKVCLTACITISHWFYQMYLHTYLSLPMVDLGLGFDKLGLTGPVKTQTPHHSTLHHTIFSSLKIVMTSLLVQH